MRDATELEVNSINDYINRISVDTDVNFYNRRGERGMTKEELIKEIEESIQDIDKCISEDEEYIRGWKCAMLTILEKINDTPKTELKKIPIDPWDGEKPHAKNGFVEKYCL